MRPTSVCEASRDRRQTCWSCARSLKSSFLAVIRSTKQSITVRLLRGHVLQLCVVPSLRSSRKETFPSLTLPTAEAEIRTIR